MDAKETIQTVDNIRRQLAGQKRKFMNDDSLPPLQRFYALVRDLEFSTNLQEDSNALIGLVDQITGEEQLHAYEALDSALNSIRYRAEDELRKTETPYQY